MSTGWHKGATAILLAAAALFVTALGLAFELLRTAEEGAQQAYTRRHQLMARRIAHEVEDHVAFRVQTLSAAVVRLPGLAAELRRAEERHSGAAAVYRGACVWSYDGRLLEADPPGGCSSQLPAEPAVGVLGGTSQPRHRMVTQGRELVVLMERMEEDAGTDILRQSPLVLALRIDIDTLLRNELEAWNADLPGSDLWVVDETGRLIYHSHQPEMVGRRVADAAQSGCSSCHPPPTQIQALVAAGDVSGSYTGPRGRALASLARARLDGANWTVVVNTPADDTVRIVHSNARRLVLVLGLLVLAFAASGGVAVHASWTRDRAQQAERAMKRQQELSAQVQRTADYLQTVLASSDDLVFTVGADDRIVFANARLGSFLGLDPDTLPGRDIRALFGPEAGQRLMCDAPLPGGSLEIAAPGRDGDEHVLLVTRSAVAGTGEVVMVGKDVTERKRSENALRVSEQQYRAVFERSRDPMFIVSTSGRVRDVNDAGARLLGFTSPDAIRGHLRLPDLYADSRQARRQGLALQQEGWLQDEEVELKTPAGRRVVTMLTAWTVKDSAGRAAYHAILRDVTEARAAAREQHRLQRDMQRAAAEWRRTVDALDAAVLVVDAAGYVRRMNRAACLLPADGTATAAAGDFESRLGRRLADFGELEPWTSLRQLQEKARVAEGPVTARISDALAGRVWDGTAVPLADELSGTVLVAADVTHALEMEEATRRGATLATMGALVAGVAHEVRNPLFGISANVDALEAIVGDKHDLAEPLSALRRGVGRLTTLMEELLMYGRPAPERLPPCAVAEVLTAATGEVAEMAAARAVGIELVAAAPESRVAGDRSRLGQVFRNLLENAVQHSPEGGRVIVEASSFARHDRRWVRCTVTDCGPGFRQEDLPRVFEPFFTRRRGGTGLGLAIVQRVVAEHSGRLHAGNAPAGGAVVTVELPLVEPAR